MNYEIAKEDFKKAWKYFHEGNIYGCIVTLPDSYFKATFAWKYNKEEFGTTEHERLYNYLLELKEKNGY